MGMNSPFAIFSLTVMEDMVQVAQIPLKDKLAVVMFIWGRLWILHQYPLLCLT
jgi:hypothetical protein